MSSDPLEEVLASIRSRLGEMRALAREAPTPERRELAARVADDLRALIGATELEAAEVERQADEVFRLELLLGDDDDDG